MSDREDVRELLRELLKETLANGDGHEATVPPPPVAAVLRPSTWSRPPAPGEVIGESPGGDSLASSLREHRGDSAPTGTEVVRIENDADLAAFVGSVLDRGATRSATAGCGSRSAARRRARASCASSTAR